MRWVIANIVMRILFFSIGFHWVTKKGKQASAKEAPILVVGPHSSYFDAFPFILMGAPSIVAKSDVANVPAFGSKYFFLKQTNHLFCYYYYRFTFYVVFSQWRFVAFLSGCLYCIVSIRTLTRIALYYLVHVHAHVA